MKVVVYGAILLYVATISKVATVLASYPGSLIIAGEEKRAWFQSLANALNLTC